MSETRMSGGVAYRMQYRAVWCTKYRRPVIDGAVEARLREIVEDVCAERGCHLGSLEIRADFVELDVECLPQESVHKLVKAIKARSSSALRSEFRAVKSRLPTLWTNNYFVATIGDDPAADTERFVESQPRS